MTWARRSWPVAALGLGALVPMAGVLAAPTERVVGTPLSDVYKHVWSWWHTLDSGLGPRTDALGWPEGGVLLDMMWGPTLLLAPVTALLGPTLAANLWIWLSLVAIGAASWWLARELVGPGPGALLGGLAAQTATPLLGYPLVSGVHERLAIWIFPLLLGLLLRVRDGGGWRPTSLATGALAFAALGCQAYGLYGGAMLLLALPLWLGRPGDWATHSRRMLPAALALGAAMAVVYGISHTLTVDPASLVPQPGRLVAGDGPPLVLEAASLAELLDPRAAAATAPRLGGDELWLLMYLGWATLIPAVLGAALHRGPRRWELRAVTALAVGMALHSLGPTFTVGGLRLWNPVFSAIAAVLPHYGTNPPVWQHVLAVSPLLAPGLAAAVGLVPRHRATAALLALGLIGAERVATLPVSLPLPTTSTVVSPAYDAIVAPGAVAEIPRVYQDLTTSDGRSFLAQTVHGRPLPHTINIGPSPWDRYAPVVRGVARDWGAAAACLRSAGIRYAVVHRDHYVRPDQATAAVSGLAGTGSLVGDDGTVAVIDLGPVSDPPAAVGAMVARTSQSLVQEGLLGRPLQAQELRPEWVSCPAGLSGP